MHVCFVFKSVSILYLNGMTSLIIVSSWTISNFVRAYARTCRWWSRSWISLVFNLIEFLPKGSRCIKLNGRFVEWYEYPTMLDRLFLLKSLFTKIQNFWNLFLFERTIGRTFALSFKRNSWFFSRPYRPYVQWLYALVNACKFY